MEYALVALGALILGFIIAFLYSRPAIAKAEAQRDAAAGQLDQIKADRETLKESIQAFSAEQLKENREQFLKHAEERLGVSEKQHASELDQRHQSIEKQFKDVQQKMETFEQLHREIEKQRTEEFGSLRQQVTGLAEQTRAVEQASQHLSTALRGSSQSRGKWGEMALRNIVEVAGMTEHCDFVEQDHADTDKRPDMVVMLPGEGRIPIDAKVPFADYDRAMETDDPQEQKKSLETHGKIVRTTMLDLAKRDYPTLVGGKVDYTVMFIPVESVAAAAFAVQPDLQQEALAKKILITTPVTLIALLKTVGLYWQQEKLAANAQVIWDETRELHDRLKVFHAHLAKVGKNLGTAVDAYNKAVGSFDSRVLPKARTIEELSTKEGLPELDRIEKDVRETNPPRLDSPEH